MHSRLVFIPTTKTVREQIPPPRLEATPPMLLIRSMTKEKTFEKFLYPVGDPDQDHNQIIGSSCHCVKSHQNASKKSFKSYVTLVGCFFAERIDYYKALLSVF